MKKIVKHSIITVSFMLAFLGIMALKANAASISVSTSKSSVSPGETFNATVSVNGGAGAVSISVSNGNGSTTQFIDNSSYTFTCTAGTSGKVSIVASGTIADYTTELDESKSASKSVSIVVPTTNNDPITKPVTVTKSSDANLVAIMVEGYNLTPEFTKSNTEYSLTVPNEVTSLKISAKVNNSKATYSVTEIPELQVGANVYTISVKAEDGTAKKYNLTVTRERAKLILTTLAISSIDNEGNVENLDLEPIFNPSVYAYRLTELSHTIKSLKLDVTSNLESAIIETVGNDELVTGENIITVTAIFKEEGKEDEIVKYEITVIKEEEPVIIPLTKWQQIQKWFKDVGEGILGWYTKNQAKFMASLLLGCSVTLLGLTVYLAVDYKKYRILVKKVGELTELNSQNANKVTTEETSEKENYKEKIKTVGKHAE